METSNAQVVETINHIQATTMDSQVILTSGAGKAYQSVAQSSAIAVQDAADALRNLSTIATTAIGVAMAQLLETSDQRHVQTILAAQQVMKNATDEFARVGSAAAALVKEFPAG